MEFNDLLILMVVVWTAGKFFRSVGLPVVFGELIGGIIVGPTVLGLVDAQSEVIEVLAHLGIFFLMLHTGLHSDAKELYKSSGKSLLIAIGGFVTPFALGYLVSRAFDQSVISSLFIAIGLSISSIALVTRMFRDCELHGHSIAHVTLGAAVIQDIIALILFSVILSTAQTGSFELSSLFVLLLKIIAFFGIVLLLGAKSSKYLNKVIYFGNKGFTLTLILALLMGMIAESIGLHSIIGAFLAGLFMSEDVIDRRTFEKIEDRIYGLSYSFFGPIFFASLAFHLDYTAFAAAPLFLLSIMLVAIVGKVLGSGIIASFIGFSKNESLIIGLAMNNRGAVELIIASIGLEMGLIDATVFSILILMAFVTTVFSILAVVPCAKRVG